MNLQLTQAWIAATLTAAIAFITYLKCRGEARHAGNSNKEFFLAGGGLSWLYIAGSITITNLSTDQLLGMNGNQMALLAWWELSGVVGLSILAWVFLPIYYRNDCTTVTELLEKKYGDKNVRAVIAAMFLLGNIAVFQPIVLFGRADDEVDVRAADPDRAARRDLRGGGFALCDLRGAARRGGGRYL
jgi:solute:Na+ symporter, SSS family